MAGTAAPRSSCDTVLIPASGQRLVLFRPQPGTGTAERFDMVRVLGVQTFVTEDATANAVPAPVSGELSG